MRDHVFAADLGVDLFRPFQLEVGTHFENALLTVDQLLDRGPDADSTQVIFLTDGQPFGDRAETTTATLDQLASRGLGFYVLQITGTEPGEAVQHMADRHRSV